MFYSNNNNTQRFQLMLLELYKSRTLQTHNCGTSNLFQKYTKRRKDNFQYKAYHAKERLYVKRILKIFSYQKKTDSLCGHLSKSTMSET